VITLPRTVRVWAYGRPVDLRKGYNGLEHLPEPVIIGVGPVERQ
jgi:hypothetical protein